MKPLRLQPNQPLHFYRGGQAIAAFRGLEPPADNRPEDWLGSVTTRFGSQTDGLTILPDGRSLREAVEAEPEAWLGPEHVASLGADPYLLVKLLDAAERLPVHLHPDRRFAGRHLGLHHGKTEAWIVLGADGADGGDAAVYLGFAHDVEAADLRRWVDDQDVDALLGGLNRLDVSRGDSVLVPAGTPHAIGAGIFCVELQEPTDLSIMLETAGFGRGSRDGHLGLGYDLALECVQRGAVGPAELDALWRRAAGHRPTGPVETLFGPQGDPFFRAERICPSGPVTVPAAFGVAVITAGKGTLATRHGGDLDARRGDIVLIPHAAGALTVSGPVEVIRCLPPRPEDVTKEPEG